MVDISQSRFPFGQPLQRVEQTDKTPRKVFVLGVYSSAVHAEWLDAGGRTVARALAVASEPSIFWKGEGVAEIIERIELPKELGTLRPAAASLNGPSGHALDERILRPLGVGRAEAWLADLVPHSCLNSSQRNAIERAQKRFPRFARTIASSVPEVPKPLIDDARREELLAELRASKAESLVLLGDQPIRWFLNAYDPRWTRLSEFQDYGAPCAVSIDDLRLEVIALAHPRQIASLGTSSPEWAARHDVWEKAKDAQRGNRAPSAP